MHLPVRCRALAVLAIAATSLLSTAASASEYELIFSATNLQSTGIGTPVPSPLNTSEPGAMSLSALGLLSLLMLRRRAAP